MGGRRGFVLADLVIGLSVVLVLAGVLARESVWSHRAAARDADVRAATAAAEAATVDLAQGQPAPGDVKVEPATPMPEAAVPGHTWVRATAVVHGRSVTLFGLARGVK
jgi:hypothetical protein